MSDPIDGGIRLTSFYGSIVSPLRTAVSSSVTLVVVVVVAVAVNNNISRTVSCAGAEVFAGGRLINFLAKFRAFTTDLCQPRRANEQTMSERPYSAAECAQDNANEENIGVRTDGEE